MPSGLLLFCENVSAYRNSKLLDIVYVMRPMDGHNFKVTELKDALQERGLSTRGTKAELIRRLSEQDPNIWATLSEKRDRMMSEEDASIVATAQGATGGPNHTSDDGLDDHVQRELMLIRKERELLEREQQLLRREREMSRSASTTSSAASVTGNVRH